MKWSCNVCQFYDYLTSQSRKIRFPSQKNVKFLKSWHYFFGIVRARKIWQIFQLQFLIEKWTPYLTISTTLYDISVAIAFQRPKCVNLTHQGTNAYEIVGNRRVKIILSRWLCDAFRRDIFCPIGARVGRVGADTRPIGIITFRRRKGFISYDIVGTLFARFLLLRNSKKGTLADFRGKNDENFGFCLFYLGHFSTSKTLHI